MNLSKIELETLLLLANRGPLTGYDLHSKKRSDGSGENAKTNIMSEPYWIKLRKKLLQLKLIEEFPEEGRRKPYIVGENGFDYLIRAHIDEIYDFDTIAEYCKEHFQLVFGHWADLKVYGLADYVKDNLSSMIYKIYFDINRDLVLEKRKKYSHQEFIEDLYTRIYVPDIFSKQEELHEIVPFDKIMQFRRDIPEIKSFVQKRISEEKAKALLKISRLDLVEKSIN